MVLPDVLEVSSSAQREAQDGSEALQDREIGVLGWSDCPVCEELGPFVNFKELLCLQSEHMPVDIEH